MSMRKRSTRAYQSDSDDDVPPPLSGPSRGKKGGGPGGEGGGIGSSIASITLTGLFFGVMYMVTASCIYSFPTPLPLDADEELFAEARAKVVVDKLAGEYGVRDVGSFGHKQGIYYVYTNLEAMAANAIEERPDLNVEVGYQLANGTFAYHRGFLKHRFSTSYTNMENVMLRVAPANMTGVSSRGVLVNSHVDSTLSSPGASDAGMCVAVMMEAVRTLLTKPAMAAPVVFLFNGAEETFHQGAHAFMTQHEWSRGLRAVLNLESTGAGGFDLMFQAAGGWAAALYAKHAKHPHASPVGADLFNFKLV
eukprot:CAMPEP_0182899394 /NCGR_PEP_ID=MMETSP0034_2-20130328/28051_1 /TAXON_ID=156128 /ORGANISM="Nephroselmis pyriformis, Strain CCMP717" /LENGTH=306 /DNA_ID=CAMNT_0025033423 /DNA_START=398 /DNA_END=1315 /DNA_ORIENTATION=-